MTVPIAAGLAQSARGQRTVRDAAAKAAKRESGVLLGSRGAATRRTNQLGEQRGVIKRRDDVV